MKLSSNALTILEQRYLTKDTNGELKDKPQDLFRRVAKNIALADLKYEFSDEVKEIQEKYSKQFYEITETNEFKKLLRKSKTIKKTEEKFYRLISSLDFLPNSPTLLNSGRKLQQLAACFVVPIEDNISSIFMALHDAALIHKTGAGTGFNFSKLRPNGDVIESSGLTTGPVSFMKVFDAATQQVKLGGVLRGANMGILNVDHPDIEEFINLKSDPKVLTNFNNSVGITDKFMEAVKKNKNYPILNPRTKETIKELNAKDIFRLICTRAWSNGDPGVIFLDRINEFNPTPKMGRIESTDSCGEQPLLAYESCNLGSLNLANVVSTKVNFTKLKKNVHESIHFLDNVIDMCDYPLSQNRRVVEKNRKIGLGVMGFADLLIKMNISYGSDKGISVAEKIMKFISKEAQTASIDLAKKRGVFPSFDESVYNKNSLGSKKNKNFKGTLKLRNATRTTIAPTGTISIIADCSSGIEPLFALSYVRKTVEGKKLVHFNEDLKKALKKNKVYDEDLCEKITRYGSLKHLDVPEKIKKVFVVGSDIDPEWHVKMQAAFQKYVDNGISKTVTLPKTASVEEVEKIYVMAYELGCKGISIYRFGSREGQVIFLSSNRDEQISLGNWVRGVE